MRKTTLLVLFVIVLALPSFAFAHSGYSGGMGHCGGGMYGYGVTRPAMHYGMNIGYYPSTYDYSRTTSYYPNTYEERLPTRNTQATTSYNLGSGAQHSAHH